MSEFRNPFIEAKIVADGVSNPAHHEQDAERGDPAFVMSQSSVKVFSACPLEWRLGYTKKTTEAMELGRAMDIVVHTPDKFDELVAVQPATQPASKAMKAVKSGKVKEGDPVPWNGATAYAKEWTEEREGKLIISAEDKDGLDVAFTRLMADEDAREIVKGSRKQVLLTAQYMDKATGLKIPFCGLLDLVPGAGKFEGHIFDFKFVRALFNRAWTKAVMDQGMHIQAAIYLDLWNAATGENRELFGHIAQANYSPFVVGRKMLSLEMIDLGRGAYLSAMRRYCECLKTQQWPDYDTGGPSVMDRFSYVQKEPWMINTDWSTFIEPNEEIKEPLSLN